VACRGQAQDAGQGSDARAKRGWFGRRRPSQDAPEHSEEAIRTEAARQLGSLRHRKVLGRPVDLRASRATRGSDRLCCVVFVARVQTRVCAQGRGILLGGVPNKEEPQRGQLSILRALQDAKLPPPKHGQVQSSLSNFVTCGCRVLIER
jgi:hypothetical protein